MRTALTFFLSLALSLVGYAADFARASHLESVDSFVSAAKAFRPTKSPTDIAEMFTIPELGQPDDPRRGKPVVPEALALCEALWTGDEEALVFAAAKPKTNATNSAVGVLFLLTLSERHWIITDTRRFTATGKYADVLAELTSDVGTGYRLGTEGMRPIITIRESHGGRGYGYQLSASFTHEAKKLKRLELE